MGTLGFVQAQGARYGVEHLTRGVPRLALLQAGVVGRADAREHRQLLAPQPRHPAPLAVRLQPDVTGAQLAPACLEELGEVPVLVHGVEYAHRRRDVPHPAGVGIGGVRSRPHTRPSGPLPGLEPVRRRQGDAPS